MRKVILMAIIGILAIAASALWVVLWGHPHWSVPELAAGGLALALAALAIYF